jgi:hypothetical protein
MSAGGSAACRLLALGRGAAAAAAPAGGAASAAAAGPLAAVQQRWGWCQWGDGGPHPWLAAQQARGLAVRPPPAPPGAPSASGGSAPSAPPQGALSRQPPRLVIYKGR